jgi:hypothetical protein
VIVLDTYVLSELMKVEPNPGVMAWVSGRAATSLFTTTTQAEFHLFRFHTARTPSRRS